jgi:hypothetical protein
LVLTNGRENAVAPIFEPRGVASRRQRECDELLSEHVGDVDSGCSCAGSCPAAVAGAKVTAAERPAS